jgi:glycosyltransferase involved in cell wall biosynthesis
MCGPVSSPAPILSVLVPVYNEESTIATVVGRLCDVPFAVSREIIIIDDGSTDGTRGALAALAPRSDVRVIQAPVNRGKGSAIRLGLAHARGEIVAIQDADLELDPSQLSGLVGPIARAETAVVYGSRFLAGTPPAPAATIIANRLLTALTNLLFRSQLTDMETCYKVMRTEVARSLALRADRFDIEPEITAKLLQAGHHIVELPVRFEPRSRAAGKKIGWRDGIQAIQMLLRTRVGR